MREGAVVESAGTIALISKDGSERLIDESAAPIRTAVNGTIEAGFVLDEGGGLSRAGNHEHDHAHAHSKGIDTFTVFFERP